MYVRYRITVRSRLVTPLQSDTIFGHLCWGIKYLESESDLDNFLGRYNTETQPIRLSSAVPSGKLPRPFIPPLKTNELKAWFKERTEASEKKNGKSWTQFIQQLKTASKISWISIKDWKRLRENLSSKNLTGMLMDIREGGEDASAPPTTITAHNSILRSTGRVMEGGGLYFISETWEPKNRTLDIYCEFAGQEDKGLWEKVWEEYITPVGFGKDKSTGAGHLTIEEDQEFNGDIFSMATATAWMTLSHTALNAWDANNAKACYKTMPKFGKLGGDYAVKAPHPFKRPVIMILPGGVFFQRKCPQSGLLNDIYPDTANHETSLKKPIVHYGIPLCLPARMEEKNDR